MNVRATMVVLMLGSAAACGEPFTLTGGAGGAGGVSGAGGKVTTASGTTSTTATGMGGTCTWDTNPCKSGYFCKPSSECGSGQCVKIPGAQSYELTPVCGCDGVTYWNTSVAHSYGVPVKTATACGPQSPPKQCSDKSGCPTDRACSRNEALCTASPGASGTCIGLPFDCSMTQATALSCASPKCALLCDLITHSTRYTDTTPCKLP